MVEYRARKDTSLLPSWVREYQQLEEGPQSIPEQQTQILYDRIGRLEQKLSEQAQSFETTFHGMDKAITDLRDKLDDKTHGKRKRKRTGTDTNTGTKKKKGEPAVQEGENGNEILEHDHFENGGAAIGQDQGQAPFAHTENYAPYYQERARYTGAWR